jgi:selenocysteine lyase/cysteine desulfurase
MPGVRVLDRGRQQGAIVTMTAEGHHADTIVRALKERRINTVSSLREFGIYDFDAKGVQTAVRLSPHYYNTEAEVDAAVAALGAILG